MSNTQPHSPQLIAEVWRGEIVESRHYGHIAVVDPGNRQIFSVGDTNTVAYLRSSAKPFQALPLILSGAADRYQFSEKELAIACGSHSGSLLHTTTAAEMLQKIGLEKNALKCGAHEPVDPVTALGLHRNGTAPDALHNNCSGKHSGMLAVCRHTGQPIETYDHPDGPLQQSIYNFIVRFSGASNVPRATDGCGVPTFALSVRQMALMFARLVSPPSDFPDDLRNAPRRLISAMMKFPEMVQGPGELDTELMKQLRPGFFCKGGAEGLWCAGVLPCEQWPTGLGITLKIDDGGPRARSVVAMKILERLGMLNGESRTALRAFAAQEIKNHRGDLVGKITTAKSAGYA